MFEIFFLTRFLPIKLSQMSKKRNVFTRCFGGNLNLKFVDLIPTLVDYKPNTKVCGFNVFIKLLSWGASPAVTENGGALYRRDLCSLDKSLIEALI